MAVAFILAGPVVNPIVIASTWIAFDTHPIIAVGRFALVLAVSITVAMVFSLHPVSSDLLASGADPLRHSHEHQEPSGLRIEALLRHASSEFFEMGRYLVAGAVIGAALQTVVPRTLLLTVGQDPVLSVIALMGLAVVLSVCSTVDAFVALSLASTFTPGAILAFLAFGPMVDLKSTLHRYSGSSIVPLVCRSTSSR